MTSGALPPPMLPAGLVLPGIARLGQIAMDLAYLDDAPLQDPGATLAAIELYVASYRERPTGSLPADEGALLALLTPQGRAVDRRAVLEAMATRWTPCSDGRLHRAQLAVGVMTTWLELALLPDGLAESDTPWRWP